MVFLFELISSVLFITLVMTQMIIPAWKNLPLFPFFRRRKIIAELTEANEGLEDTVVEKETENVEKIADKLRKSKFKI